MTPREAPATFSGGALRAARILAGKSLADLGRDVDVSRQFISQLETGERQPNLHLTPRLARALSVESTFFSHPLGERIEEAHLFFRCKKRTLVRDRERASEGVRAYRTLLSRLIRELRFPTDAVPALSAKTGEEIERGALECRDALGVGRDGPIRNMVRAVESAGVFTTDLHCAAPTINAFSVRSAPCVIVRSTANGSSSQSRMDVAHEIGHLALHASATGESWQEDQADRFAGALLIPRAAFIEEFPSGSKRIWRDLFRMKARWGMSVSAIVVRARQLGLIDERRYRSLFVYISRSGWRRQPEPEEPQAEFPELVPLAFKEIYRARRTRPIEILRELGWTDTLFERVVGDGVANEVLRVGAAPVLQLQDARAVVRS